MGGTVAVAFAVERKGASAFKTLFLVVAALRLSHGVVAAAAIPRQRLAAANASLKQLWGAPVP